jgi:hypothetical protein
LISTWIPDAHYRNYGDALTELLLDINYGKSKTAMVSDGTRLYFLIGSVIFNLTISQALANGYTPVFIGCGWRGAELDPQLVARAKFIGCRGPQTREALLRAGIDVPIVGDSAYEVFKKIVIENDRGGVGTVLTPHISDDKTHKAAAADFGVDQIIDAKVKDTVEVFDKIELFANAEFVLGGAMHACVTAHHYGVPFAPFATDYIDCPPKWIDWLESIGVPGDKLKFSKNIDEGQAWYDSIHTYL